MPCSQLLALWMLYEFILVGQLGEYDCFTLKSNLLPIPYAISGDIAFSFYRPFLMVPDMYHLLPIPYALKVGRSFSYLPK